MRLRIVRPLPLELEGFDLAMYRFGASYDIGSPLCDILLVDGYGVPDEDNTAVSTMPDEQSRKPQSSRKKGKARPLFTTTPATPAPPLRCPTCDASLVYRETVINGVAPIERWDVLICRRCGAFEYRHRTKKLRPRTL